MRTQLTISKTGREWFSQKYTGIAIALFALILPLGCGGDGLERVQMSGKVSYAGQPVRDGQIRFVPTGSTQMPLTIEPIVEGQYNTNTSGGVPVGEYLVDIRAYNPDQPEPKGPGDPARQQLLPDKYNNRSELSITLESGQKNIVKDFELTE